MDQLFEYHEIADEAWKHLEDAADDHSHPMRLVVVSTLTTDNRPDARILVLRGASREKRRLWMHTDCRSTKVEQLQKQPEICVVGYDRRDDVQLRIYGQVVMHHGDEIAERHWEQTNMVLRNVYESPHRPGETLPEHDPRVHRQQAIIDTEHAEAGRYNFLVMTMIVESIDWIQVSKAQQRRARLRAEADWAVEPLAP